MNKQGLISPGSFIGNSDAAVERFLVKVAVAMTLSRENKLKRETAENTPNDKNIISANVEGHLGPCLCTCRS